MPQPLRDITGQQFGRLTVHGLSKKRRGTKPLWECLCRCPKRKRVFATGHHLRAGLVKSCGCLKAAACRANAKKANEIVCEAEQRRARRSADGKGYSSRPEVMRRLKVTRKTIHIWETSCPWLGRPLNPRYFALAIWRAAPNQYPYYLDDDIDQIEKRRRETPAAPRLEGRIPVIMLCKNLDITACTLRSILRRINRQSTPLKAGQRRNGAFGTRNYVTSTTEGKVRDFFPSDGECDADEAARILDIDRQSVDKYARIGVLSWRQGWRTRLFSRREVEALFAEWQRNPPRAGFRWQDRRTQEQIDELRRPISNSMSTPADQAESRRQADEHSTLTATPQSAETPPAWALLGIEVDSEKRRISRNGATVDLGRTDVQWHILWRALEHFPEQVPIPDMLKNYPGDEDKTNRLKNTGFLNDKLEKIRLRVKNRQLITIGNF
jgi:hypothetical protein